MRVLKIPYDSPPPRNHSRTETRILQGAGAIALACFPDTPGAAVFFSCRNWLIADDMASS